MDFQFFSGHPERGRLSWKFQYLLNSIEAKESKLLFQNWIFGNVNNELGIFYILLKFINLEKIKISKSL